MLWAVLRRKAASAGSSNLGKVQSLGKVWPAVAGSMSQSYSDAILTPEAPTLGRNPKLARQIHQGVPVYSMPIRNVVSSLKSVFSTQMWSRSFSSDSGDLVDAVIPFMGESISDGTLATFLKKPGDRVEVDEPISQIETDKVTIDVASPKAGVIQEVPMTRLRKRVATRLKDSQNTFALLTTFNEVDMTNLMKLRCEYKDAFLEKHGVKLGLMSGFVKVSCRMMQSSRSLIQRVTPVFAARIRQNSRLLSSASSSLLAKDPQSSPASSGEESVHLSDNCVRRMKELQADEAKEKLLRISIEAGGCSGFQYNFALEEKPNDDDRIFERGGVKLVVDTISLGFVKGATVDYVEELIRSGFQVAENPSAVGGCSCKSSFMVK